LFFALSAVLFGAPLKRLVSLSLSSDTCSQIILIPLITAGLIVAERKRIFARLCYSPAAGAILLAAGVICFGVARAFSRSLGDDDALCLIAASIVFVWLAGFTWFYGIYASRAGCFALLFLFLLTPLPEFLLARIILALRQGSAAALSMLYSLLQVPFQRDGMVFSLPGVSISIAPECSGIRSSISLFITGLLAGHLFLRSAWRRALLMIFIVPLAVLKNAIRLATISLLSAYVDPGFLTGRLHHQGGFVFALISMGLLVPVVWLLQWSETRARNGKRLSEPTTAQHSLA
jgi:exosortase